MNSLVDFINYVRGLFAPSPKRQQELEEAKKLFYSYDCNSFFMMKEGESKNYARYCVERIRENKWRDEFVSYWLEKMIRDGFNKQALWHIRNASGKKSIPVLIDIAHMGDSYVKFWLADTLLSISDGIIVDKQGRQAAIKLLKSIVIGPVIISEQYRQEIDQVMMKFLDASTPEEYLINYSKRKLAELKVKLSDL